MRLSRSVVAVTLSACIGYCAVLADASPSRHEARESKMSLSGLGQLLPQVSPAASAVVAARQGFRELRGMVQSSALMHDSRPSDEAARQAHVALWAALEADLRPAPTDLGPGPSGLLPGQD
ncbi:hypothetical protein [Solidesulfovibrio magneticus]|uniref:Uncharacterized protein n=1 Tax=Solidesulfovibrio magneticus (strain ATCC 700980 / DSM 13731 / RS-1) TaxID=573370 RepID=C4XQ66_SOLM1|nr:hypothetical protein [Solidesulfovibrio magneticus]BAH75231.1 hypothetical protein DMR_17400 [Solidesulfovibrio magneticus RS-1]